MNARDQLREPVPLPVLQSLRFPDARMVLCTGQDIGDFQDVLVRMVHPQTGDPQLVPVRRTLRPNDLLFRQVVPLGVCSTAVADAFFPQDGLGAAHPVLSRSEAYEYRSFPANRGDLGLRASNTTRPVFQGQVMTPPAAGATEDAWTADLQDQVAIKRVRLSLIEHRDENTVREVEALQYLAQLPYDVGKEYIIPQRALLYDESYLYNVQEFANNGNLKDAVAAHGHGNELSHLPEEQASRYAKETLSGLGYMHYTGGICHDDMKLENVTVKRNGNQGQESCAIIDLGQAKRVPHILDANGQRIAARMRWISGGSAGYRSPQARYNHAYDGFKNDVWAVGIMVVNMVTATNNEWTQLELRGRSARTFNTHLDNHLMQYNPELSDAAKKFIHRLLTPDEALRPSVEEALEDPWLQMYDGQEVWVDHLGVNPDVLRALQG
mmetsp:Transcript_22859/g.35160  ORF Transcript_22859/g.35160 Transcript_22859/m.35160 type:complete len:438 (+) Transcript_22859:317-1630(+)